jgi:PAS domain S-box-containing protein
MTTETPEIHRLNWALSAFARSSAALIRFTSFQGLVPQICDAVVGNNDYLLAAVGLAEDGPNKPIRFVATAGLAAAYLDGINLSWSDEIPEGRGPAGQAIRSGVPWIMRDSLVDERFAHWRKRAQSFGIRSSVTVPFVSDDGVSGILAVYAGRSDAFGEQELDVFVKLAHELAFARAVEKSRGRLQQSEARYRMLAENGTDIILQYDCDERIVYSSPSIRQLGYAPEDVQGRSFGSLKHPSHLSRARQGFADALAGQAGRLEDWLAKTADGRWIWMEGRLAPLLDNAGTVVGVLLTLRDAQGRKQAKSALREVNAELTRVARIAALDAFSASLAHEINQPLAAMVMNSQSALRWLSDSPPNLEAVERALRRSERDALRATGIVERLRAMVTKAPAKAVDFDMNEAITEVLALTEASQQQTGILAMTDLCDGALMARGDRIQLQQVMMNLILNALEAMQSKPVAARRLLVRSGFTADREIQVEVEDRGGGIDEVAADRIFEHLFTTKVGGTGLGLAISRSIIEAHGGRIWVEPAWPHGAIFKFSIQGIDGMTKPADAGLNG